MPHWILSAARPFTWLLSKARQRVRKWTTDKQRLLDETVEAVSSVKDFLRRASPMAVSVESVPGEIRARLEQLDREWSRLRPRLVQRTDRHPSDDVQRLGNDLAEMVDRLLIALRYMANPITDPADKAAAVKSTMKLHENARTLADEVLETARAY